MSAKLLKPQALKSTDKIAIIPLASPVKKNIFDSGLEYLSSINLKPKVTLDPVFQGYKNLFSAASPKTRVNELNKLYKDKELKGIFSLRGGYGSVEMLPLVDFKVIKKNPKIFSGISDVTAHLVNLYDKAGLITIHGPSLIVSGFKANEGNELAKKSLDLLNRFVRGEIRNPFDGIKLEPLRKAKGKIKGRLIGGNLTVLTSLLGTKWDVNFSGHIVFLEEIGEVPYKIHRMFQQMKQAGKFKGVKALILGDFIDSRKEIDKSEPTFRDVILDVLKDEKFPILAGLPVGHGDLNYPIPIGVNAEINQNRLDITEAAVVR